MGKTGQVKEVKILGTFALIDEGETDWKIICIDVNDRLANELSDLDDVERRLPNVLTEIHQWLRDYKTVDGKPQNKFAFDGQPKPKEFAELILKENHEAWKKLMDGFIDAGSLSIVRGDPKPFLNGEK